MGRRGSLKDLQPGSVSGWLCRLQRRRCRQRDYACRMLGTYEKELVEAEKSDRREIARQAVERVRALYAVERLAKDASVEARLQITRRRKSQTSAGGVACTTSRSGRRNSCCQASMAEAINYALGQWQN